MGWIYDYRGRGGDVLHHLPTPHTPLQPPDSHLYLGISIGLARFVLDVLLGHLHRIVKLFPLPNEVDATEQEHESA